MLSADEKPQSTWSGDTLFVELADRERIQLATFDEKVLKSFPKLAKRPSQLARGR